MGSKGGPDPQISNAICPGLGFCTTGLETLCPVVLGTNMNSHFGNSAVRGWCLGFSEGDHAWTLGCSVPSTELPGNVGDRDFVMSLKFISWSSSPSTSRCAYMEMGLWRVD